MLRLTTLPRARLGAAQTRPGCGHCPRGLNVEQRLRMSSETKGEGKRSNSVRQTVQNVFLVFCWGFLGYDLYSTYSTSKDWKPRLPHGFLDRLQASFLYDRCDLEVDLPITGIARHEDMRTPSREFAQHVAKARNNQLLFTGVLSVSHCGPLEFEPLSVLQYLMHLCNDKIKEEHPFPEAGSALDIVQALKNAFLSTDELLVHKNGRHHGEAVGSVYVRKRGNVRHVPAPYSSTGASAIVGIYDSDTRCFSVALTGDGRAVLGRPMQTSSDPSALIQDRLDDCCARGSTLPPRKRSEYGAVYRAVTLAADQTPSNADEQERLEALHPGKKLIFDTCKGKTYLGIPTTRAFGYGCLKWSLEFQRHIHEECLGDALPSFFSDGTLPGPPNPLSLSSTSSPSPSLPDAATRSPRKEPAKDEVQDVLPQPTDEAWTLAVPDYSDLSQLTPTSFPRPSSAAPSAENAYLTAEPEVTTVHVKPGDFIVLGSKDLFECLSDEEVVGLVGVWIEERRRRPKLRQYTKYSTPSEPESQHDSSVPVPGETDESATTPYSLKLAEAALLDKLNNKYTEIVQTQESGLKIRFEARQPVQFTRHFVDLGLKRFIDPQELPVATEADCTLPRSVGVDDDEDANLLKLSLKNSGLNAARKSYPQFPYSWRSQGPNFIFDDTDLCSVTAHLTRNAFNTKGRNLTGAILTHKWGQMKGYKDDIAIQVIFFE